MNDEKANPHVMSEQHSQQAEAGTPSDPIAEQALAFVERWQAELDELREQLVASNRLGQLGMLTAALAHETNNRLTPIRSYAQLALANMEDPAVIERALRAAVAGAEKIAKLNEHVIGLASPNPTIQTCVCDCREAVESAIEAMTPLIKQHAVDVQASIQPTTVRIDGLALEQILINLITNACHAMQGTTGRRQVQIDSEQHADRLIMSVRDSGPGVSDALRKQLFEAFATSKARGQSTASDDQVSGSGLGLNICRQLIEAAGGTISLAQTSDRGSTFRLELPVASAQ